MKKLLSVLLISTCLASSANALDAWGIYDDKPEAVCNEIDFSGEIDLAQAMEKAICANPALKISYFYQRNLFHLQLLKKKAKLKNFKINYKV